MRLLEASPQLPLGLRVSVGIGASVTTGARVPEPGGLLRVP